MIYQLRIQIFFTHSEATWFRVHGLFRETAFSIYNWKRRSWTGRILILSPVVNARMSIGVRAIFCQGGGNPFAQKILASCPNFYKTVERKLGPCSKIGRTGIWKWLDTVFQSQYLPSLSINYVATNKHLEKIATTVVLGKEGNLSRSGLQWHRSCHSNEMTPLPIILAAIFLTGNCSYKIVQGSSFLQ